MEYGSPGKVLTNGRILGIFLNYGPLDVWYMSVR